VDSNGQKCPILFVGDGKRVNVDVYQDLLWQHVVPWVQRTYPDSYYVFQQDLAATHTARTTHKFLREKMADFSIWSFSQKKVQVRPHGSLAALCQCTIQEWHQMSLAYICRTCNSF
jgi:hypothetical protein